MRRADRVTGLLLLAFAAYTVAAGRQMGYWQGRIPGPGFAPMWIGGGLALVALFLVLRRAPGAAALQLLEPADGEGSSPATPELLLTVEIVLVTVASLLLVPRVGMLTGVSLLLLVLIKLLKGTWRSAVGAALVLPIAFYLLFVRWLQVPVPKGPWGF